MRRNVELPKNATYFPSLLTAHARVFVLNDPTLVRAVSVPLLLYQILPYGELVLLAAM
jgi:hypothetical protein